MTVSGTNLWVVNEWSDANNHGQFPIGEYTTSGGTVNASLISGLNDPQGIVVVPGVAVPDQGSSLALLAMGAGGILALRRWRTAQERS
jgi:hypothetical protein